MATYNYLCADCERLAAEIKGAALTTEELWEVIFETSHHMEPTEEELAEARICPRCHGQNTEKTFIGVGPPICYVRGNGYLDRAGCHRDMALHKITTDDPYDYLREPGEAEDLANKLRRGGQHNPHTKYFPT